MDDYEKRGCAILVIFVLPVLGFFGLCYYNIWSRECDHYVKKGSPHSLVIDYSYTKPMKTKEYGVSFYVKSYKCFNKIYPIETQARADIEDKIINDYSLEIVERCKEELSWPCTIPKKSSP